MTEGTDNNTQAPPSPGVTAAVLAVAAAAWIAAGSTGLLAHPLRNVLTWIALAAGCVSGWPRHGEGASKWPYFLVLAAAVPACTATNEPIAAVAAVALTAIAIAALQSGANRRAALSVAVAAVCFALYQALRLSVPAAWLFFDRAGVLLGKAGGAVAGRPLLSGATFGGVDFLVFMLFLLAPWLCQTAAPRASRAVFGIVAILATHLLFLVVVAFAGDLVSLFPKIEPGATEPVWRSTLRHAVPWNLPLVALLLHGGVLAVMMRWPAWRANDSETGDPAGTPRSRLAGLVRVALIVLLGAGLAAAAWVFPARPTLEGKKVVLFEKGFLNWLKPEHGDYGRLSIGMYGLLPRYLESLGAECLVSSELSAEDLEDADLLVLIYPNEPWEDGQLDRIWKFTRDGGALWVLGEHTVWEDEDTGGGARFNDVLEPTHMRVQFDSGTFAVGGWLHSYESLAHPMTLGVPDERNQLGIVIGASLDVRRPARPIVIGRWGWSDWGDMGGGALMGDHKYNAGERLGDIVLAAEERLGKGRVLLFGDTSTLSNGINMGAHPFTARVFADLAGGGGVPAWRYAAVSVAAVALLLLALSGATPTQLAVLCVILAVGRIGGVLFTHYATEAHPDTERLDKYRVAYIDSSHIGNYSAESWREDGLMGLCLNLMRNGFLTLMMPDFSAARLQKADLVVSVAPMQPYSDAEVRALKHYVRGGGTLILAVGYPDREPVTPLLEAFGFDYGYEGLPPQAPRTDPRPMGHFKSPYYNTGEYMVHVRFHAGWPVFCREDEDEPDAEIVAYGAGNHPIAVMRRYGGGKVMLVGDSGFPLNKNLEVESGYAFEGMRENPHFWRWLITFLDESELWVPPNPAPPEPETGEAGAEPVEETGAAGTPAEAEEPAEAEPPPEAEGPAPAIEDDTDTGMAAEQADNPDKPGIDAVEAVEAVP